MALKSVVPQELNLAAQESVKLFGKWDSYVARKENEKECKG